jgi:hypothetical protein
VIQLFKRKASGLGKLQDHANPAGAEYPVHVGQSPGQVFEVPYAKRNDDGIKRIIREG